MTPAVSSYLDSISNPTGHFTTLRGIFPVRDPEGGVRMVVRSRTVDFRMQWRGEDYLLKCFLGERPALRESIRLMADWLPSLQSPFLTDYRYLPQELAVTDSTGRSSLHDVILERIPAGRSLHTALLDWTDNGNTAALRRLLRQTADLSEWLSAHGMVHRNLRPSAVRITGEGHPVLSCLEYAGLQCTDEELHDDDGPLCRMALVLTLLCCRPSLYRRLGQERCLGPDPGREIARALLDAEGIGEALRELASAVAAGRAEERDRLLWTVAEAPLTLPGELPEPLGSAAMDGEYPVSGLESGDAHLVKEPGQGWVYLDGSGFPLGEKNFEYAEPFSGGRAVVGTRGLYGLLGIDGTQVIPPIYDEVVWEAETGVAAVCMDGLWGLCDSTGQRLTGIDYEWLSSPREGMILAQREGRFGYLDRRGGVALEFIYDQATSFSGGRAEVSLHDEQFIVGYKGERL